MVEAHAVRTDQGEAGLLSGFGHTLFQALSLFVVDFGEARGEEHHPGHFFRDTLRNNVRRDLAGYCGDDIVDLVWNRLQARVVGNP